MKYTKILLLIILLVFAVNAGSSASAVNSGFTTRELSEKDKDRFLSNVNITILDTEPERRAIECFDVSKDGLIAVGQNSSDRNTVCVYSDDGVFQYGYRFNCSGSFGVEWNENNLNIFFDRSDVIVELNPSAQVMSVSAVENTIENNAYINHFIRSEKRTVGDTVYTIKNDMGIFNLFASDYSQLTVSKPEGEIKIIYDVNTTQLIKTITVILLFCGITVLAIIIIVRKTVAVPAEQKIK